MEPLELPDIPALLDDVDWDDATAPGQACLRLRWILRDAFAARRDLAAGLGRDVFSIVRNELAQARPDGVATLSLLLALVEKLGTPEHRMRAAELVAALPPLTGAAALAAVLLQDERAPSAHEYRTGLRGAGRIQRLLLYDDAPLARDAASVATRLQELADAGLLEGVPDVADVLLRLWRDHQLPPLSAPRFERLPSSLRVAVLASTDVRRELLAPALDAHLRAEPLSDPDTPDSRGLEEKAERAALARDFADIWFGIWLDRVSVSTALKRLSRWVTRTLPEPTVPTSAPEHLLSWLSTQNTSEADRVYFAAAPHDRRLPFFAQRPPAAQQELIARVADADCSWALLGCDEERLCAAFVEHLDVKRRARILTTLVQGYPDRITAMPELVGAWMTSVDNDAVVKTLRRFPTVALAIGTIETLPSSVTTGLLRMYPHRRSFSAFERLIGSDVVVRLLCAEPHAMGELLAPSLHSSRPWTRESTRRDVCTLVGRKAPELFPTLFGDTASVDLVETVLSSLDVEVPPVVQRWLLTVRRRRNSFVWRAVVTDRAARKAPVPPALQQAVENAGGDVLLDALRLYPDAFVDRVIAVLPPRELIALALRHRAVAVRVEQRVDRETLRAEMSWFREQLPVSPADRAAIELALAFSLVDAAWLIGLSRQAGQQRAAGRAFDDHYRVYELPKQAGGTRTITVPDERLKRLQRRLLHAGFAEVAVHDAAHGFRAGRSVLTNAWPHIGKPLVVNADIESFFPSTSHAQVLRACRRLLNGRLSDAAVRLVADICCYDGALPTGAPTSPAIANIVLAQADQALATVAARHGVAYTRYADDLTFSGGDDAKRIIPFVRTVLADYGFVLDEHKLNLYRRGRRQIVAGLVVNEKPNLARRVRRQLRAAVHARCNGRQPTWHGKPMSDNELRGWIAYLNIVQPQEAAALRGQLEAALAGSDAV